MLLNLRTYNWVAGCGTVRTYSLGRKSNRLEGWMRDPRQATSGANSEDGTDSEISDGGAERRLTRLVSGFGRRLGGASGSAVSFYEVGVPGKITLEAIFDVGRQAELMVFVGVDD